MDLLWDLVFWFCFDRLVQGFECDDFCVLSL